MVPPTSWQPQECGREEPRTHSFGDEPESAAAVAVEPQRPHDPGIPFLMHITCSLRVGGEDLAPALAWSMPIAIGVDDTGDCALGTRADSLLSTDRRSGRRESRHRADTSSPPVDRRSGRCESRRRADMSTSTDRRSGRCESRHRADTLPSAVRQAPQCESQESTSKAPRAADEQPPKTTIEVEDDAPASGQKTHRDADKVRRLPTAGVLVHEGDSQRICRVGVRQPGNTRDTNGGGNTVRAAEEQSAEDKTKQERVCGGPRICTIRRPPVSPPQSDKGRVALASRRAITVSSEHDFEDCRNTFSGTAGARGTIPCTSRGAYSTSISTQQPSFHSSGSTNESHQDATIALTAGVCWISRYPIPRRRIDVTYAASPLT